MEVSLQAGKSVSSVSVTEHGKFLLKVEKRTVDLVDYVNANYVLVATGSSPQVSKILSSLALCIFNTSKGRKLLP
jgi:lysine/ornithine N-monooxygenase